MKNKIVKDYYEGIAHAYDNEHYVYENKYPCLRYRHNYMLEMLAELDIPNNAKILDVGCGPGEMVKDLVKLERHIVGIDIAEEMVLIAKEKFKKDGVDSSNVILEVGDIEDLKFDAAYFDVIICSGVIEYLKDDVAWLSEIKRTLKTNGYLIINVTNKYSVRRWTSSIIERIKSNSTIYKLLNVLKVKILKKGQLHYFPFKPRTHSPNGFDKFMNENGFEKIKHNYFDFAIFPAPLDTLFGFLVTPLRIKLEKMSERDMKWNGTGYIVLFKKSK